MHPDKRQRQSEQGTATIDEAFAQRDRTRDRYLWPDAEPTCSTRWARLLRQPPDRACHHHAATCRAGRPGRWFTLASDLVPVRRCAACLPPEIRTALSTPTLGGMAPAVVTCDCCGGVGPRAALSVLPGGLGAVVASMCSVCFAQQQQQQRSPFTGRLS